MNGLVEHFNKILKQMLSKVVYKRGQNWDKILGTMLLAYRATFHASIGMSPFYLVYGKTPCLPTALDFMNIPCDGDRVWSSTREGAEGSEITSSEEPSGCTAETEVLLRKRSKTCGTQGT